MRPDHPRQTRALRRFLVLLLLLSLARLAFREGPGARRSVCPHRIALNRAGSVELMLIPGVGPTLARRIVVSRHTQGRYERYVDLQRVPGVGRVLRERIARYASLD